jgi:hemN_rel: putative oxygen-independent coproporphyrinogen III oxidase
VKALCKEISYYGAHCRDYVVSTVYIGGGTPSWLWESDMAAILDAIQKSFSLLPEAEVSIECNPGTVTAQKFAVYRQSGINRISLGLQSAQNVELKMLGRIHTWEQFLKTYELARSGGFSNINVDLMSSLPGQHIETYADSLQKVCRLKPEHISAYSLIIEKGTPFYDLYKFDAVKQRAGMVTDALPTEDEVYEMTKLTEEMLKENGYVHYEVSNFAQPGYACRHNIGYWTRVNYLGMGLGASSLMENIRYTNTSDLYTYLEQVDVIREGIWENKRSDGTIEQLPATNLHASAELVGKYAQMEEFMYLGLRMIDGISRDDFFQSFGMPIEAVYQEVLNHLQEEKLLERRAGRIYLTPKGQDVSNYALAQFLFDETS